MYTYLKQARQKDAQICKGQRLLKVFSNKTNK